VDKFPDIYLRVVMNYLPATPLCFMLMDGTAGSAVNTLEVS
jgi:hypothetical protein